MKNPIFYANSAANAFKKSFAWRKIFLATTIFTILFALTAVSVNMHTTKGKVITAGLLIKSAFPIMFKAGEKGEGESDADFAARKGKAESPEAYFKRYQAYVDARIKEAKDNPELKAELQAFKTQLEGFKINSELVTNLKGEVERVNLALEALKEAGKKAEHKDIVSQLKVWKETNKATISKIRNGEKAELPAFEYKTASPMTPSNTYNSSAYLPIPEFAPGATDIVRVQPTFWDYITKGRTGSAAYVWVNKKNPLGAAGFIGPGVAKPGISFELETEISNAKKIAVNDKCATELLEDIDGMATYIQQELSYQLRAKLNTTLMTGVSSSTVPAGIQTISTTFTLTTVATQNPSNWDAVVAIVAQLRSGNLMGPVTAFMNPVDYANMKLTKAASQGQLFIPSESGATIVEDNNIPVGYIQAAILPYYKVLVYKDFTVTFGWENDDFTKNLVTTIAEMRIHQFFSENYTGFAVYDQLATIKAAITIV